MSTADKIMAIFELFGGERHEWTVEAAASELEMPVSSVYRYFRSLADAGLVVAISTGRYVLGPTIIMLDRQMRHSDPLITAGERIMQPLSRTMPLAGVLLLCRFYRRQVMCVHSIDAGDSSLEIGYERGRLMPLYRGAASKVILAHLPPRTVKSLFSSLQSEFAASTLGGDWHVLRRKLREIRSAGVSVTYGEVDPGVVGVSSPVRNGAGEIVGSLGFVAPAQSTDDGKLRELVRIVIDSAARIVV